MGLWRADYICLSSVARVILWHRQQPHSLSLLMWALEMYVYVCVYVFVWRIYLKCFAYNRGSETHTHTHTHTHTNTHINTERGAAVTCAVHSVCWCINLHCALHFLPCVFRRCESGIKHLSAVTVATPLVWGMNTRGEGGERERVRRREMASREIEQNERRQEARWRDDQIKTCGSLHRCPKGSHLSSPPLSPHGPEAT